MEGGKGLLSLVAGCDGKDMPSRSPAAESSGTISSLPNSYRCPRGGPRTQNLPHHSFSRTGYSSTGQPGGILEGIVNRKQISFCLLYHFKFGLTLLIMLILSKLAKIGFHTLSPY